MRGYAERIRSHTTHQTQQMSTNALKKSAPPSALPSKLKSAPPSALPSKLKLIKEGVNLSSGRLARVQSKRVKAKMGNPSNALLGVSLPMDLKERIRLAAMKENRSMANFCVTYLTRILEERGF
jgi:hypothetical protein